MSSHAATIRAYIEGSGYEVVTMSDGHASAVPMDTAPVLAALSALESELSRAEEALRDLVMWADEDEQRGTDSLRSLQLRLDRARAALSERSAQP